jgi:hypothetical protein
MGLRLTTQDYWNIAIGMGGEYIGAEFMRDLPKTDEMRHEDRDVIVSAIDLAAAHGKEIAERYGVRGDIIHNLGDESIWILFVLWYSITECCSKEAEITAEDRAAAGFMPPLISLSQSGVLTPASSDLSRYESGSSLDSMVFSSSHN